MNIQRSMLACAAVFAASMSASHAGPCSAEITQIRDLFDTIHGAKASAAMVPESTAGTMHHQPTPNSVGAAEVELGLTSPEVFDEVKTDMAKALEADAAGDQNACEQALADAKRLLGSAGTQTDDARR
jgi:hypothetical protein